MFKVPVSSVNVDELDVAAVAECVRSGWLSRSAPVVAEFEKAFAEYCECTYGVSTCSCSSALDLALQSFGVREDDEVIIPTFTMVATANAVKHAGATPVLVDCEPDTWCMNPRLVQPRRRTKAIIPVHIYGHLCDLEPLAEYPQLKVIEDAAEVHGSEIYGLKAPVYGECACYSFFANKNMTTGEGGMIVTNDKDLADTAQWLKANAFGKGKNHFLHEAVGSTVCMSAMQAALGLSQLKRLDKFVKAKREAAQLYNLLLADLADADKVTLPVERPGYKNTYWMYSILINDEFGISRDELMDKLAEEGIETRTFFIPLHQQPPYKKYGEGQSFPVADYIGAHGLNLPSSSVLTHQQIQYVSDMLHKYARHN